MFIKLAFLLILMPILEVYVLLQAKNSIGTTGTIMLIIATGITGGLILRHEGFATLSRIQASLAQGQIPGDEIITGVLILIGGTLLLTPGFLTDLSGFLLLTPGLRRRLNTAIQKWLYRRIERGEIRIHRL